MKFIFCFENEYYVLLYWLDYMISQDFRLGSVKSFKSCTVSNHYTQRERPRRDGAASLFYVSPGLFEIHPVNLYVVAVCHQKIKVMDALYVS